MSQKKPHDRDDAGGRSNSRSHSTRADKPSSSIFPDGYIAAVALVGPPESMRATEDGVTEDLTRLVHSGEEAVGCIKFALRYKPGTKGDADLGYAMFTCRISVSELRKILHKEWTMPSEPTLTYAAPGQLPRQAKAALPLLGKSVDQLCDWLDDVYERGIEIGQEMPTPPESAIQDVMATVELMRQVLADRQTAKHGGETIVQSAQEATVGVDATQEGKGDPATDERFEFVDNGDGYSIVGFGESGHVKRLKGFDVIARLLRTPGKPVAMIELIGAAEDERISSDQRSYQPTLDSEGIEQSRTKLQELYADQERFREEKNSAELDVTEKQIADLEQAISSAVGRGRRTRDLNNEADKLRPRIHQNLTTAYKTLYAARRPMTKLADHFSNAITSEGATFVYRPASTISWDSSPKPNK